MNYMSIGVQKNIAIMPVIQYEFLLINIYKLNVSWTYLSLTCNKYEIKQYAAQL